MESNKLNKDTALAKIKVMIGDYYEKKGRGDFNDAYSGYESESLIETIDDILDNSDIDAKNIIVEKLELDKNEEE